VTKTKAKKAGNAAAPSKGKIRVFFSVDERYPDFDLETENQFGGCRDQDVIDVTSAFYSRYLAAAREYACVQEKIKNLAGWEG
jgi:hypothetical protein